MYIDNLKHLKKLRISELVRLCVLSFIISVAIMSFGVSGTSFAQFGIWMIMLSVPVSIGFAFHGIIIAIHLKRRFKTSKLKPV